MPADEHIRYVPEWPSVDYRIVILAAIASLLLVAGAIGVLYTAYQRSVRVKDVPAPQTFSQPRVAPSKAEVAERTRLASEQERQLETWQWADQRHTLVQIPIERAMQILAQRGNDAWAAPAGGPVLTDIRRAKRDDFAIAASRRAAIRGAAMTPAWPRFTRHAVLAAMMVIAGPAAANFTAAQLAELAATPPANAALPNDLVLRDEDGRQVSINDVIGGVPAVVVFADYACRTLCGPIVEFAAAGLAKSGLRPGLDYRLLAIGLNPRNGIDQARTTRAKHIDAGSPDQPRGGLSHGGRKEHSRRDSGSRPDIRL